MFIFVLIIHLGNHYLNSEKKYDMAFSETFVPNY